MIDKLTALEQKFVELSRLLADPSVIANQSAYQKHAKAYRELEEIVERFREFKEVNREIEETRSILESETDPEMRKLADEERARLEERAAACQSELQRLMMPKDPNDEKNVLLEIRAGTGGDEATL